MFGATADYIDPSKQNWKLNHLSCADPEIFVRGGITLTIDNVFLVVFLVDDDGREDPNTTKNGPSLARQRNAI